MARPARHRSQSRPRVVERAARVPRAAMVTVVGACLLALSAGCSGTADDATAPDASERSEQPEPVDATTSSDPDGAEPDASAAATTTPNPDDTAASTAPATSTTTVPPWERSTEVVVGGPYAALTARTGDIDNLGYGWPAGFDPFAGGATPVHDWTFTPEPDDPRGTDRIMVVSAFDFADLETETVAFDGYTTETDRGASMPEPIVIEWDPADAPAELESAAIQLFVDDLQSPFFGDDLVVTLDGRVARDVSRFVSGVDQSGPIGRLITIGLLPEFHDLLTDGRLEILVDGPHHEGGEGFAIDFARVVIDPAGWEYAGQVSGSVVDAATGAPLAGVLVSATNVVQAVTGVDGSFVLDPVPAGRVVVGAGLAGYDDAAVQVDLEAGGSVLDLEVALEPIVEDVVEIAEALDEEGSIDLYGITFEPGEAILSEEAKLVLADVLGAIYADPERRVTIVGHTDDVGTVEYNRDLSERRAQAVVDWLVGAGLPDGVATAEGRGQSEPIADNATEEGRALNRRVELRVVQGV